MLPGEANEADAEKEGGARFGDDAEIQTRVAEDQLIAVDVAAQVERDER